MKTHDFEPRSTPPLSRCSTPAEWQVEPSANINRAAPTPPADSAKTQVASPDPNIGNCMPNQRIGREHILPAAISANRSSSRLNMLHRNAHGPIVHRGGRRPALQPVELLVTALGVPSNWGTKQIYETFCARGNISRIELLPSVGRTRVTNAKIHFRPKPHNLSWLGRAIHINDAEQGSFAVYCRGDDRFPFMHIVNGRSYPEHIPLRLAEIDFGMMKAPDEMSSLYSLHAEASPEIVLDTRDACLDCTFKVETPEDLALSRPATSRFFKMRINVAEMRDIRVLQRGLNDSFVISLDAPPQIFRKTTALSETHSKDSTLWDERSTWFRQTNIDLDPTKRSSPISLHSPDAIIDVGRWLTYRFVLGGPGEHSRVQDFCQALADYNVRFMVSPEFVVSNGDPHLLWAWSERSRQTETASNSWLEEMSNDFRRLAWSVEYQLESCISLSRIQECNVSSTFLHQLSDMDPNRAVKVLEKVAEGKDRVFDPNAILQIPVASIERKAPRHCLRIPSATVTPTTIYVNTPVLETSNRVIRRYQEHYSHFLRVKFMDEKYRGRLRSSFDRSMDEVYSRINRAMTCGILIGGRKYEFLAFGNSQFREHGAYFFAATANLTAEKIRQWMGNFNHIQVVAKYASRLGQCFSTTRAIPGKPTIVTMPDVERNGYNFTDGVGKISPILARMILTHYGIAENASVFQFRLGGCKGILVVDPALKRPEIHLRKSQQKFPSHADGLEICQISRFTAANLNIQIILILSALGVSDAVFMNKLQVMMKDFKQALWDETKAFRLLCKNVDYNQSSLALAGMIQDGFMSCREPFFMACLRLWRAWNLKYLKEKGRIFIEKGASIFGTVDETGLLKGYYFEDAAKLTSLSLNGPEAGFTASADSSGRSPLDDTRDRINQLLPQIFLQVPLGPDRKMTAITGRCLLTRNPALHPGDARVVLAIDLPELHHLENCVVFPQTGDRDLASMCSGGDLDGDEYLVLWDEDILPTTLSPEPMDYTPPEPQKSASGRVTVNDITSFFVRHIKNDNLGPLAVAHRYWADASELGVKDPKCIQLAHLHSKAVDYAKTGIAAEYPRNLKPNRWPHWSEPKHKARSKIYHSKTIVGQIYDAVQLEPFNASLDCTFDPRILNAATTQPNVLEDVKEVKKLYDEAFRRLMKQYGIQSEFEVWTTYVLSHSQESRDWKFAEILGELVHNLQHEYQDVCYVRAGTTRQERDWAKLRPFLVAMYQVTAAEFTQFQEELSQRGITPNATPIQSMWEGAEMPLISFPWLFPRDLGRIATDKQIFKQPPLSPLDKHVAKTLIPQAETSGENETRRSLLDESPASMTLPAHLPEFPEGHIFDPFTGETDLLDFDEGTEHCHSAGNEENIPDLDRPTEGANLTISCLDERAQKVVVEGSPELQGRDNILDDQEADSSDVFTPVPSESDSIDPGGMSLLDKLEQLIGEN